MTALVVARGIARIRERVTRTRELLPETVEQFLAEQTIAEAVLFNLFLALQECSNLAMHVVADRGLGVPGNTREAFELLGRAGLIEGALASQLSAAVGLRNRIAHQYADLDLGRVHRAAPEHLGDLLALAAAIAVVYPLGET